MDSFSDIFYSVVHNRGDLSDIQKFLYLKTCCQQDASRLIESLEVTAENYQVALELLKKRYENKRAIINHHVNGLLFKLPEVVKESHTSLRKLIDNVLQHKNALEKLRLPTQHWDMLLIPLIVRKLDDRSRREWENKQQDDTLPTLEQLTEFLQRKCFALETYESTKVADANKPLSRNSRDFSNNTFKPQQRVIQTYASTSSASCYFCQGQHGIYACTEFVQPSSKEKFEFVRKNKLCANCLKAGHFKSNCNSGNCRRCDGKHNTLLHEDNHSQLNKKQNFPTNTKAQVSVSRTTSRNLHLPDVDTEQGSKQPLADAEIHTVTNSSNVLQSIQPTIESGKNDLVLLSTAIILVRDKFGNYRKCNALLDSGSQSNLITQSCCKKLGLNLEPISVKISGINQGVTNINCKTKITVKSVFNKFMANLACLVLPTITEKLPLITFDSELLEYPKYIKLADDKFYESKEIDILLGASIFYDLIQNGRIMLGKNKPVLVETVFGWIFTGQLSLSKYSTSNTVCNVSTKISNEQLHQALTNFWKLEELPETKMLTPEEKMCEEYFERTTIPNKDGRFIVRLPFKTDNHVKLGNSKSVALKRFLRIESRFEQNCSFKQDYIQFMREYEEQGHMSFKCHLEQDNSVESKSYFLPHHAVIKDSSVTTKCRVVFDASAKTLSNVSLNDLLMVGSTVQDDLFSIVLRLRLRRYVLSADIKAMYRQILVDSKDRNFQQVLWRYDKSDPISVYHLNTVTYGTASAPFLATRCLQQLALDHEKEYPITSQVIRHSFYMDDLLVSLSSIEEAVQVYKDLTKILSTAGFELRKWSSNESKIVSKIQCSNASTDKLILFHDSKELKTLGIVWNSQLDIFSYSVKINYSQNIFTKRSVLSIVSQIFDPLGLVGPVIIKAKIFLQQLWQMKLDWDQALPNDLNRIWRKYLLNLDNLNSIEVSRQVICDAPVKVELHGFSDASESAYGACVYLCSTNKLGQRFANLLCAKSKVAPLKKMTLPRLELLGATLLANLVHSLRQILDIKIDEEQFYCDSTIVLSWLQIHPSRLKTYIANRIVQISEMTNIQNWKHVKSEVNPADVISRGMGPDELMDSHMWWHGPSLLINTETRKNVINDTVDMEELTNVPEVKMPLFSLASTMSSDFSTQWFEKYGSLSKLQRVVAYIFRFKNRTLRKDTVKNICLSSSELESALTILIRMSQAECFVPEINALSKNQHLPKNSKLLPLNPFLDKEQILRVGGRLSNSDLEFNQKHPIILPEKHKLTYLIVRHEHFKHLHAGVQNLLSILRLKYWPIHGKSEVNAVIRKCLKCFRVKPKPLEFLMGDLPKDRVTPSRPFSKCGVDYCGPIMIKANNLRKSKLIKTYVCIFVCFAVRAVHIELVTDLTTESFINALKRFISRRGKPSDIYSDNGLNFVGANNHFIELYKLVSDKTHNQVVTDLLAKDFIRWHFIPARSPHMGGLWEATVKSVKFHLRRVLGNSLVSYEEMYTILVQIEACLNSRPLTAMSNDPDDYLPLTPAHFLIGDSLAATPQRDLKDLNFNRLSRYQRLQQLTQQFWSRWASEYLRQLQARTKWKTNGGTNIEVGTLVIMIEANTPPLRWPMARVIALHPGKDEIVRVVSVKVANGQVLKRSINKLCVVPLD